MPRRKSAFSCSSSSEPEAAQNTSSSSGDENENENKRRGTKQPQKRRRNGNGTSDTPTYKPDDSDDAETRMNRKRVVDTRRSVRKELESQDSNDKVRQEFIRAREQNDAARAYEKSADSDLVRAGREVVSIERIYHGREKSTHRAAIDAKFNKSKTGSRRRKGKQQAQDADEDPDVMKTIDQLSKLPSGRDTRPSQMMPPIHGDMKTFEQFTKFSRNLERRRLEDQYKRRIEEDGGESVLSTDDENEYSNRKQTANARVKQADESLIDVTVRLIENGQWDELNPEIIDKIHKYVPKGPDGRFQCSSKARKIITAYLSKAIVRKETSRENTLAAFLKKQSSEARRTAPMASKITLRESADANEREKMETERMLAQGHEHLEKMAETISQYIELCNDRTNENASDMVEYGTKKAPVFMRLQLINSDLESNEASTLENNMPVFPIIRHEIAREQNAIMRALPWDHNAEYQKYRQKFSMPIVTPKHMNYLARGVPGDELATEKTALCARGKRCMHYINGLLPKHRTPVAFVARASYYEGEEFRLELEHMIRSEEEFRALHPGMQSISNDAMRKCTQARDQTGPQAVIDTHIRNTVLTVSERLCFWCIHSDVTATFCKLRGHLFTPTTDNDLGEDEEYEPIDENAIIHPHYNPVNVPGGFHIDSILQPPPRSKKFFGLIAPFVRSSDDMFTYVVDNKSGLVSCVLSPSGFHQASAAC